jgi:hypothetical protein
VGSASSDAAGRTLYRCAQVGPHKVALGAVVLLEADEDGPEGQAQQQQHEQYVFGQVQCMWVGKDGAKMAQVGVVCGGGGPWVWRWCWGTACHLHPACTLCGKLQGQAAGVWKCMQVHACCALARVLQ